MVPWSEVKKKKNLKDLRKTQEYLQDVCWIVGGEFNMIRNIEDKRAGVRRVDPILALFNDII